MLATSLNENTSNGHGMVNDLQYQQLMMMMMNKNCSSTSSTSVSEIQEEGEEEDQYSSDLFEINHGEIQLASIKEEYDQASLFSFDIHEDCVYVAIGKGESSIDALSWTLRNAVNPSSTTVYLVHVYAETHYIPSPLGKLPKNQVSPEMVDNFMAQERGKRREFLQKFINMCSASQVKVDTMLVESDLVAKAILDLIPILNIRKLVVGTTKSNLRKLKSRRGSGIADQVLESALESCEIKIVCEGKEVIMDSNSILDHESNASTVDDLSFNKFIAPQEKQEDGDGDGEESKNSISCMCFKTKF